MQILDNLSKRYSIVHNNFNARRFNNLLTYKNRKQIYFLYYYIPIE